MRRYYNFRPYSHTMSRKTYSKLRTLLKAGSIAKGSYHLERFRYGIRDNYFNFIAAWDTRQGLLETCTARKHVGRVTKCLSESRLIELFLEERNKKVWRF